MKSNTTYSINVKVLEEFNEEVASQGRSAIVEAMIIKFLMDYSEIPTLYGKDGKYYCPKCKRNHNHGGGSGHRVAHCSDRDNYPKGYFIKEQ